MKSACNQPPAHRPHPHPLQSSAISMQSACNQHAISHRPTVHIPTHRPAHRPHPHPLRGRRLCGSMHSHAAHRAPPLPLCTPSIGRHSLCEHGIAAGQTPCLRPAPSAIALPSPPSLPSLGYRLPSLGYRPPLVAGGIRSSMWATARARTTCRPSASKTLPHA